MKTKIKQYIPIPFRVGTKNHKQYEVLFDDKHGHSATLTLIDYVDKKGNSVDGYILRVRWDK